MTPQPPHGDGSTAGPRPHSYYPIEFEIGAGNTDYEKYIRTPELLVLQKTPAEMSSPEELLFQVSHQTAELWMKQMLHDLDRAIGFMNEDALWMASRSMRLVCEIQRILIDQVDLLGRNLSIMEYEQIRLSLGQGSGMESPGFNWLLLKAPQLKVAFQSVIERRGVPLRTIYREYQSHLELHTLCEYMVEFDDQFHKWRTHHFDLVRRTIGLESNSLKGIPTKVLQRGVLEQFFPELYELRNQMTNDSSVAYGGEPLSR